MFLGGNPVDGFVAIPKANRALGVAASLNPNAFATGQQATAPAQTVSQEATAAIQAGLAPSSAIPGVQSLVSPADLNTMSGVCTSDGNLVYIDGAWLVRSQVDVPCASSLSETSEQIIKNWKVPIWVGPFQVDLLNNPNGQITNLTDPSVIGPAWGAWLLQQVQSAYQTNPRINNMLQPWVQLLPLVVGQTQWLQYDGTPLPSQYIGAKGGGSAAWAAMVGPFPYPNGVPAMAGTGIKVPIKAWTAPDANGILKTFVQYGGDPNTYSYYSWASWLNALSPVFGQQGLYLNPQPKFVFGGVGNPFGNPFAGAGGPNGGGSRDYGFQMGPNTITNWNSMQLNGPWPWAKFKHPVTGADWGVWVAFGGADACASAQGFANIDDGHLCPVNAINGEGLWNSAADAPFGATLQIGIAPIPQESTLDSIEEGIVSVLGWIPTQLASVGFVLAKWMEDFACSPSVQQGMLSKVPPNPYSMAAAAGALALANATNCGKIDCSQPANFTNPQCAPPSSTTVPVGTPWYQQWWVIAAGVGLVAYLLLSKPEEPKGA
jgi:hypothetical protein